MLPFATYRRASRQRSNLACTHSPARTTLREALNLLAEREPAGGYAEDLAALDGGLGPLDHGRYDAETRMALARAEGDVSEMARAEAAIAAHDAAAAALGALRTRALAGLDAMAAARAVPG